MRVSSIAIMVGLASNKEKEETKKGNNEGGHVRAETTESMYTAPTEEGR